MATTSTGDEIIEKRASSPIATSCLVISAFALIGAILLQMIEVGEIRAGLSDSKKAQPNAARVTLGEDLRRFREDAKSVKDTNTAGDETLPKYREATESGEGAGGADPLGDVPGAGDPGGNAPPGEIPDADAIPDADDN